MDLLWLCIIYEQQDYGSIEIKLWRSTNWILNCKVNFEWKILTKITSLNPLPLISSVYWIKIKVEVIFYKIHAGISLFSQINCG